MTGILAPRRQHLSCYVRSAERLANWEAARRCIVVAGIVAGCRFAALQRKTWRSRVFRGEWRNLHFLALVMVSYAKPARGGRSCVCTTVCARKYCKMHAQQGRQETMLGVDERGQGPDRKADRKRMRDVDVASVVVVGVKRRVKPVACGAVQCLWAAGQRSHKLAISSVLSGGSVSSVCEAWLARGEKRGKRGSCATKSRRREALAGVAAGRQGKCKRACTGLDWTVRGRDGLLCFFSHARATDRQTRRWYWRREGGWSERGRGG